MGFDLELSDTVHMMLSQDYKTRFKAEYYQLAIRYKKLNTMLMKWDTGALDFTPDYPRNLYDEQIKGMRIYMTALEDRAVHEGIKL